MAEWNNARTAPENDTHCIVENLPVNLKGRGYFCLWRYETRESKQTKVPYNPMTGGHAKPNDPATFGPLELAAKKQGEYDGIGIGLFENIAAIDIDHCIDEAGNLSDTAADIISAMDSYAEISPSGHGIRILFMIPDSYEYGTETYYTKNSKAGVEIYLPGQTNRFVTLTGHSIVKNYLIAERSAQLPGILDQYMQRPAKETGRPVPVSSENVADDLDILQAISDSGDDKTKALLTGDWNSLYKSQSEADEALCVKLLWWTNGDEAQTERLFRQSGLYRKKWERDDYRRRTLNSAWQCYGGEGYRPPRNKAQDSGGILERSAETPQTAIQPQQDEAERSRQEFLTRTQFDNISQYITGGKMKSDLAEFRCNTLTGYSNLDKETDGLYCGLYVIAAISSLGKTTFMHQMADQIAAAGHDVLYFSLEQSRLEMVSKSLARITAQHNPETAVSSLSVRKGYLTDEVLNAQREYLNMVGNRLNIVEGNFSCTADSIKKYIAEYMKYHSTRPVVILDYLQIITPEERGGRTQTTKEAVDSVVTELKRMSRDMGLTVIAISSVNRSNYLTPIDFESLKESGNIEFTADVIWGLQLHCMDDENIFDGNDKSKAKKRDKVNEAKAAHPRDVDLVCLKNRFGISSFKCSFKYYSRYDLFVPVDNPPDKQQAATVSKRY